MSGEELLNEKHGQSPEIDAHTAQKLLELVASIGHRPKLVQILHNAESTTVRKISSAYDHPAFRTTDPAATKDLGVVVFEFRDQFVDFDEERHRRLAAWSSGGWLRRLRNFGPHFCHPTFDNSETFVIASRKSTCFRSIAIPRLRCVAKWRPDAMRRLMWCAFRSFIITIAEFVDRRPK